MYCPRLLGVANISPDSTTKVSVASSLDALRRRAEQLVQDGVEYIDIGARSTWEFAEILDEDQECELLLPGLELLKREGYRVSVDTWGPRTAILALRAGVDMLNFTGSDYQEAMLEAVRDAGAELVSTYMPFTDPYEMRHAPVHQPTIDSICSFFREVLEKTSRVGLSRVILDPNVGILHHRIAGREKLVVQARIIAGLPTFRTTLGCPLLVHSSRQDDENGRSIIGSYVISQKPEYIRTHYPALIQELLGYANKV